MRSPHGQLLTSWVFQRTWPRSTLAPHQLLPLLGQLQQLLLVSSAWLPLALVHALLQAGVKAVVCAADPAGPAGSLPPDATAAFFAAFYGLLMDGESVPAALAGAEAAVPGLQGCYAYLQL